MRAALLIPVFLMGGLVQISAQSLTGSLPPTFAGSWMKLSVARGTKSRQVDSANVQASGRFFFRDKEYPLGFYQLGLNDSDRVDIILDPGEKHVELDFAGVPLQHHIRVKRSDENKRLWDYKLASKQAQAVQASVTAQKREVGPDDQRRLSELDSVVARAMELQQAQLTGILMGFPDSYFAKVIRTDRALETARDQNPMAVLEAFDLSDPTMMRSSLYDKAVLTFLRNIHAVSEEQFVPATDSLILYASGNEECRSYMMDHLIELYSTYGPEMPLHHLIDRYITSEEALGRVDAALHTRVKEVLKVSVGADAPDVALPGASPSLELRTVVERSGSTVVFFYSSTCEHCRQEIPIVKAAYLSRPRSELEVIGIALDPDSTEFKKAIAELGIPWPCYSEFNGWGAKAAKAFQVRATPAMYVVDRRMRIVAKPANATDLLKWLDAAPK